MSRPEGFQHTDITKERISIAHTGKPLSEYHRRRISEGLTVYFKQRKFERRSNTLKEFYKTHTVWNKGLSWSKEVQEEIRESCLNSEIGMGRRAPWSNKNMVEQEKEEEVSVYQMSSQGRYSILIEVQTGNTVA